MHRKPTPRKCCALPTASGHSSGRNGWDRRVTRWAVCAALLASLSTAGCCCGLKRRAPFDKDVVAARELGRLGLDALHRRNLQEAHAYFAKALQTCPEDLEARAHFARVLWQKGNPERAIEEMDSVVRGSGDDPEWTVELGKMLLAEEEYAGALECASRALSRNSNLASAWRLRAEANQAMGQLLESQQAYHRALGSGDESAFVLTRIAEIYRQQGRPRRALSTLQRLEEELPAEDHPQQLAFWQGLACAALGRHEDAAERFVVAQTKLGDSPDLLFHLAEAQWKAGQLRQAKETVQLAGGSRAADERIVQLATFLALQDPQVATAVHNE